MQPKVGPMGAIWSILGPCWATNGPCQTHLGPFGAILGTGYVRLMLGYLLGQKCITLHVGVVMCPLWPKMAQDEPNTAHGEEEKAVLFDVDLAAAPFEGPESEVSSMVAGEKAEGDLERLCASNCVYVLCPYT